MTSYLLRMAGLTARSAVLLAVAAVTALAQPAFAHPTRLRGFGNCPASFTGSFVKNTDLDIVSGTIALYAAPAERTVHITIPAGKTTPSWSHDAYLYPDDLLDLAGGDTTHARLVIEHYANPANPDSDAKPLLIPALRDHNKFRTWVNVFISYPDSSIRCRWVGHIPLLDSEVPAFLRPGT